MCDRLSKGGDLADLEMHIFMYQCTFFWLMCMYLIYIHYTDIYIYGYISM